MSGERYTYATVGLSENREEPVVVTGKRNASFEIGGEEFDRTAILKLPERMTESEFNQWKSEGGIDLLDIYFHCLKQTPRHPKPDPPDDDRPDGEAEEVAPDGGHRQTRIVTDGGTNPCSECGAPLPEEIDEGTGVYCENCGTGQMVTDGGGGSTESLPEQLRRLANENEENAENGTAENPDYVRGMAAAYRDAANFVAARESRDE